jgi:hypothetical protein
VFLDVVLCEYISILVDEVESWFDVIVEITLAEDDIFELLAI